MHANKNRPRLAVLASGNGSTLEAFVHAGQAGTTDASVGLVICNNPNALVFNRVKRLNAQYNLGITAMYVSGATHPGGRGQKGEQTLQESEVIFGAIKKFELTVCMGYMKKIRGPLLQANIANTHTGPLPETAGCHGLGIQQKVLDLGMAYSAQTLHWVTDEYDEGNVIIEHRVPVLPGDTAESLFESVQLTEKAYLPGDVYDLLTSISK